MKLGKKTKVGKEITRQEKNRKNNLRRIGVAALAAVVIFIALIVIQSSILNQEEKVKVYQVTHDIQSGTKITEENFRDFLAEKEVQISLIPDGYITDSADLVGYFVNRNYKAKDIITKDGVTDTEGDYKNSIKNPVEVSFAAPGLNSAVAGKIREGDYINIYGLRRKDIPVNNAYIISSETRYLVDEVFTFRHVYVAKAYDGGGVRLNSDVDPNGEGDESTTLFTVILSEDDAELFTEMLRNAEISLAKLVYDTDQDYRVFVSKNNSSVSSSYNQIESGSTPLLDSLSQSQADEEEGETETATETESENGAENDSTGDSAEDTDTEG